MIGTLDDNQDDNVICNIDILEYRTNYKKLHERFFFSHEITFDPMRNSLEIRQRGGEMLLSIGGEGLKCAPRPFVSIYTPDR